MRIQSLLCALVAVFFLTVCTSPNPSQQAEAPQANSSLQAVNVDKNFKRVAGQTIYVPVYSHIYHDDGKKTFNLAATLSIRNTDLENPIVITFVRY